MISDFFVDFMRRSDMLLGSGYYAHLRFTKLGIVLLAYAYYWGWCNWSMRRCPTPSKFDLMTTYLTYLPSYGFLSLKLWESC